MLFLLSKRSIQTTAIGCSGILLILVSGFTELVIAHGGEDHGGGGKGGGEFDPNAPRVVSAETAKAIGLTTIEVDTKAISEVIHLGGVVRVMPDHRFIIAPTVAGRLLAVTKQVGDVVAKGEVIARLDSPEQARGLYGVSKLEAERARVASTKSAAEDRVVFLTADAERARSLVNNGISAREVASRHLTTCPLISLAGNRMTRTRLRSSFEGRPFFAGIKKPSELRLRSTLISSGSGVGFAPPAGISAGWMGGAATVFLAMAFGFFWLWS